MPLTQQQSEEIKKQLLEQIEKLEIENKDQIIDNINNLDESGLENFLKQNNIQISNQSIQQTSENSIFQLIAKGQLPSYKIAENKDAIAVLEINPMSEGHVIIIPKKKTSVEDISNSSKELANQIINRIKEKLNPDEIKSEPFSFQNYPAISIIPLYKDKELKKEKAKESELKKMQKKLESIERLERLESIEKTNNKTKVEKKEKKLPEISFRIP